MKIRIEGNEQEIAQIIKRFQFNYCPDGKPILEIESISKFYVNRDYHGSEKIGRVYLEVKPS